ncbi:MAG: MoaD/ThiS family protein [Planctomycetota bacterium]
MPLIRVLLFAAVRDAAGESSLELALPGPITAGAVSKELANQLPAAGDLIRVSRIAVNGSYVADEHEIDVSHDEVALIPPVSGG